MNQNLSGIAIFDFNPIQVICNEICHILKNYHNEQNVNDDSCIQIEYKFAQFKCFCSNSYLKNIYDLRQLTTKAQKDLTFNIVEQYVGYETGLHFETLRKFSQYSMVLLNPLGRKIYELYGAFHEVVHKKFYKMREFLIGLCMANQRNVGRKNYYGELRNISNNTQFKLINQSQIRLDINIRGGEQDGRYSYQVGRGWSRTRKTPLFNYQYDVLIKERPFRLAGKKEQEIYLSNEQMIGVFESIGPKTSTFLRLKRALKVNRADIVEYALSQIYQPPQEQRAQYLEDIKSMVGMDESNLNEFCTSTFQMFYVSAVQSEDSRKFEIQCEFTRRGVDFLKSLQKQERYREIEKQLQKNFGDMYALFFVDHTIKMKESEILGEINENQSEAQLGMKKFPLSRLQNEFGSYMHDIISEYMKQ